jgi:hypothetical protein
MTNISPSNTTALIKKACSKYSAVCGKMNIAVYLIKNQRYTAFIDTSHEGAFFLF